MKKMKGINIAIVVLASILLIIIGASTLQINSNEIIQNTYIKNINVGGLNKSEAKEKLKKEIQMDTIIFRYSDKKWVVQPQQIDTRYDIEKTVENAFNVNRNNDLFENIVTTIKSYLGSENKINVVVGCDENKLKDKLNEIGNEINVNMSNASIDINNGQVIVIEEISGIQLDIDTTVKQLKKALQNGIFEESLVVVKVEPEIKTTDLENVNTLLGSYSTRLTDVSPGRVENIKIATQRTSDVLLMPGEEFSYNDKTGMRTVKNGYKNATVIVSGEAVQGVGGGVCQVSTTLYNTVLYSGLEIVKVTNHSIPSSYVDKGRDATVSDSGLDFVFKNNYDVPVYVKNYYYNGVITCQIYGNIKNKQTVSIATNIDKVGGMSIKEEKDPTLEVGKEKILERGRKSYTVSTYRIYYDKNGNEIKREKIATSYYPSKQQVIVVGTKQKEIEEENSNGNDNSGGENGNTGSDNNNGNDNSNTGSDNNGNEDDNGINENIDNESGESENIV